MVLKIKPEMFLLMLIGTSILSYFFGTMHFRSATRAYGYELERAVEQCISLENVHYIDLWENTVQCRKEVE